MVKNVALMAMGGMITWAYQKYNKPVTRAMKQSIDKTMQKADDALDNMM